MQRAALCFIDHNRDIVVRARVWPIPKRGRDIGILIALLDQRFSHLVNIPVGPFSVRTLACGCKRADEPAAVRKQADEMRADSPWIRPKVERMNTKQFVEALCPKRKGGEIATHQNELAAR